MEIFNSDSIVSLRHLLHRASFGISPEELTYAKNKPINTIISELLSTDYAPVEKANKRNNQLFADGMKETMTREERQKRAQLRFRLQEEWVDKMAIPFFEGAPFLERMSLFWHGHFACHSRDYRFITQYLETIRKHSLGNFRDLVTEVSKTAAMLRYLNNQQNTKKHPNENFARELLELFTLGVGNYTEKDIQEAARAFTGWQANKNGTFRILKPRHDEGQKNFMGKTGNFTGRDIIEIVLEDKQTAYFISEKVYKYFVNENPVEIEVRYLADIFYKSNYDIKALMSAVFNSDWFYDKKNIGAKIKSPIDLLVGVQKVIKTEYGGNNNLLYFQRVLGQELFSPPNVAGWQRGTKWINNSTLLYRLKLTSILLQRDSFNVELKEEQEGFNFDKRTNRRKRFENIKTSFVELRKATKGLPPEEVDTYLKELLLIVQPKSGALKMRSVANNSNIMDKFLEITALPEYQAC